MGRHKKEISELASPGQRKSFAQFLSEDEELVIVSGYGMNYLRNRLCLYAMLPGGIFIVGGLVWALMNNINPGYGMLLGMGIAFLFSSIKIFWMYQAHKYLLTTRRVIVKDGFFNVKLISALYDKITHIEVEQGFVDRVFYHHGTINIHTAGSSLDEIKLEYIDEPIGFKNLLERLINRERVQYTRQSSSSPSSGNPYEVEGEVIEEY